MRGVVTDAAVDGGLRIADDLPEPVPADSELVMAVRALSVNAGEPTLIALRPNGWRPGQDVAGVVVRAAADGSGPPVGARIVAYPEWEGWAQRIAVPTAWTAVLPDAVGFAQAASLPVAGLTALRALRVGGAVLGRDVLVTGATGAVGQFAVQLAVASGARVTALVSGADRVAEAKALGAHTVVTSPADGGPYHLVLEGVGGTTFTEAVRRMTPGGTTVLYGGPAGVSELRLRDFYVGGAHNARVIGFVSTVPEETKGEDLAILAGLVADGRLTPRIGWTGDWSRVAAAFAALAQRAFRGKAVLTVPE